MTIYKVTKLSRDTPNKEFDNLMKALNTKEFLKKNYLTDFHCTFFTIVPGTVCAKIWSRYGNNPKTKTPSITANVSFVPFGLTKKELIQAHRDLYRTFDLRPRICWYCLKKLRFPHQREKILKSAWAVISYVFKFI